eukprot:2493893-Pyramimonas_sp.AAC.2
MAKAAASLPALLPDALGVMHSCITSATSALRAVTKSAFDELLKRRILVGHLLHHDDAEEMMA